MLASLLLVFPGLLVLGTTPSVQAHRRHDLTGRHKAAHSLHERLLVNSLDTPVDVTGKHAFQPPREGDQRGPCPGLNALANHGYISRDGIASLTEAITAINTVYGMGIELATILAVMGVVWAGAPLSLDPSFSIGSNDTAVQNLLGGVLGILGTPQGLDYSHNLIESDSSPTRDDLYVTGDAWTMNLTNFENLYSMVPEGQPFTSEIMATFAARRMNESIATNPNFYFGPFTGFIARNAGYLFILRLFANHSAEHPDGQLTHETLKSFFGVTGSGSNLTYQKGWERIPENFYKVPLDWGLVQFNLDLVSWTLQYPQLASIGGNLGSVNSFAGVDLSDPVGGLLNLSNLLEGNNLLCFALQIVKLAAPSYTNNVFATLTKPLTLILDALAAPILSLSCPSWDALTEGGEDWLSGLQQKFPGANKTTVAL
ncbi:Dothistromin biosynthesis peroxidase dotB [Pseudocercospora fuligena]|uniref:Dothistromin biosynthesis peroxidase dotB n=1 Tax=Pseudocercospora fuligena TaxID=685502 RepID=A0A8H6VML3_9PEZI|nr:Dothistromin biosynthesis peroxidase dotB [Pseudocercospora fuligena]